MDELNAFADLERRLLERLSTRVVAFQWGAAYLDAEFPTRYDSNFLLADTDVADVSADQLVGVADEILGETGYQHRRVVVRDDRTAARLAPGFTANGFEGSRELVLIHRREPDRTRAIEVEETSFDEARALIERTYREDPDLPPEVAAWFTQQHRKYELVVGARSFVARVAGSPAGYCELIMDGTDVQIGNVRTLTQFRNDGVARAVVFRAVEAAREAGVTRTFVVAGERDWVRGPYEGLGFYPIGVDVSFTKPLTAPGPGRSWKSVDPTGTAG